MSIGLCGEGYEVTDSKLGHVAEWQRRSPKNRVTLDLHPLKRICSALLKISERCVVLYRSPGS